MTKPRREKKPMDTVMSVRFPSDIIPTLDKEAYAEGVATSVWVRQVVLRSLEKRRKYRRRHVSSRSVLSYDG